MNETERDLVARALSRIPATEWKEYLDDGELNPAIAAARQLVPRKGPPRKAIEEVLDLLGEQFIKDRALRRLLLRSLPPTRFEKLSTVFREIQPARAEGVLHGHMKQHRAASEVMASYWLQGSSWAS